MKASLDDLYRMTAFIYHDSNLARSKEATLLHFVEVCGMLTLLDRKKKRDSIDVSDALCKALGWYFPLLAKMGVQSVEQLVFTKYPRACPYCRQSPHNEASCKLVKGAAETVSHDEVEQLFKKNWTVRPQNLNEWQQMFGNIYPRSLNSSAGFSTIALLEELGEIAEAVRVYDRYPHYFYGEAADVFSYLMGLANEYDLKCREAGNEFDFQAEYLARYPGLCIACGARVCVCPTVPQATVGRMAKEMPLKVAGIIDIDEFDNQGRIVAQRAFENIARVPGMARNLPYDRGDMNAALTQLAFKLAHALEESEKDIASKLLSLADDLAREKRASGTKPTESAIGDVLDLLKKAWLLLTPSVQEKFQQENNGLNDITHMLDISILIITTNPQGKNDKALRTDREIGTIRECIKLGPNRDRIRIELITAATIDDLQRALLAQKFDIIHFAGHADAEGLSFEDGEVSQILDYDLFTKLLQDQNNLKCVLLNACSSMQTLNDAFAPLVIGMIDEIEDEASIVFAKGFYNAIAAGHPPARAFEEGVTNLEVASLDSNIVAKLTG